MGSTIHFAVNPVRVVSPTDDPYTYIDPRLTAPQVADCTTNVIDSGIEGRIYWSGVLDDDDVAAVRTILVAIACEREACARAARSQAPGVDDDTPDEYRRGQKRGALDAEAVIRARR